jgi:hypothetical protein
MTPPTGILVVERTSTKDIKMRELYVQVDDLPEQTLQFGQSFELELATGSHRIKATNRLFTDRAEFSVSAGGKVCFDAANVSAGAIFAPLLMLGAGGYKVRLKRTQ